MGYNIRIIHSLHVSNKTIAMHPLNQIYCSESKNGYFPTMVMVSESSDAGLLTFKISWQQLVLLNLYQQVSSSVQNIARVWLLTATSLRRLIYLIIPSVTVKAFCQCDFFSQAQQVYSVLDLSVGQVHLQGIPSFIYIFNLAMRQ